MKNQLTNLLSTNDLLTYKHQTATELFETFSLLSNDILCLLTTEGHIVKVNTAFEQLTNFTTDEWCHTPLSDILHPEDRAYFTLPANDIDEKVIQQFKGRIKTKDNDYCGLQWKFTRLTSNYIVAVATEITDATVQQQSDNKPSRTNKNKETKEVNDMVEADRYQQLKLITKASFGAIWELELASLQLYLYDQNFKELFGYDLIDQEIDLDGWLSWVHPDDVETVMTTVANITQQGAAYASLSYRIYKNNGELAYVFSRAYLLNDTKGHPYKLIGCTEDVTSQKMAEQALVQREYTYRSLFENSPLPKWICDLKTLKLLDVNKAAIQHYGYTREEFLQLSILDLRPEEEVEGVVNAITHNQERRYWGKSKHLKKDGTQIIVEINTTRMPYNDRVVWLATINDITETEKVKEVLLKQRSEYLTLFNNSPIPQVIYSPKTFRFLKVNDAAMANYGYTQDEFLAMTIFDIRPKGECEKLKNFITQFDHRKPKSSGTWTHIKKNGQRIRVETIASQIEYEGQTAILVNFNDLTDKIAMEKKFVALKVSAQKRITKAYLKAQEEEREEIGRELHDNINQLLSTSKLYIDLSRTRVDMSNELLDKSKQLLVSAIEEIRLLSKSLLSPFFQNTPFKQALNELVDSYSLAQHFSIQLLWIDQLETMPEDVKRTFYRIIQEQLTNIVKYASAENVHIEFEKKNGNVQLTIQDDGVGFDLAKKRTGVGLSNIKNRVELFNGSATIHSAIGEGCQLVVSIPFEDADKVSTTPVLQIVIADDDKDEQLLLKTAFDTVAPQHRVTFVPNGQLLIDHLHNCSDDELPHLIVLDYNMPDLDGFNTLKSLQCCPKFQSIPKIIYSNTSYGWHKDPCLSANATAYIEKGFSIEAMHEDIRQMLSYCSPLKNTD